MATTRSSFEFFRKAIAAVALLGLVACQTAPTESGGGAYSERNGRRSELASQTSDYRRTITEGVQVGVAVGALGAAAITAMSGGSGKQVARNAVIGGVIGALIGGAAGKGVADKKRNYVQREDGLRAAIRRASANNAKLSSMVRTADLLVRDRRAEAASLARATASEKRRLKAQLSDDRQTVSAAVAAADREISQLQSLKNRFDDSGSLDSQIRAARDRRNDLDRSRDTLTDIRENIQ